MDREAFEEVLASASMRLVQVVRKGRAVGVTLGRYVYGICAGSVQLPPLDNPHDRAAVGAGLQVVLQDLIDLSLASSSSGLTPALRYRITFTPTLKGD